MADSKNYKVNLITDIEDLLKGNNELRATSRYIDSVKRATEQFSRARYQGLIKVNTELKYMQRHLSNIYSLAVRVSRLRIIPTVYLIDHATPALERLLKKLKEVNSYAVVARANIHFKMQASMAPMMPATSVVTQVDTTTTTTIEGLNIDGLISALNNNTTAINNSSSVTSNSNSGGSPKEPDKPKGIFDSILGVFDGLKSFGAGVKSTGESIETLKKIRDASRLTPTTTAGKILKWATIVKESGSLISHVGTSVSGILGGGKSIGENFSSLWSNVIGDASSGATTEEAGSGLLKGGLKAGGRLLGFLSLLPDTFDFMKAQNNEERGSAIGSAVGGVGAGILGGVAGSALPGVGTAVVGAIFAVGGSIFGREFGKAVGGLFNPATPNPSSVTKDTTGNNTMFIPDLSNLTGIPFPPNKNMLAPKPSFADRYVTPVWENNIKPRVNNPAPSVPPQPKANEVANKARITTTTKTSVQSTVQLSDTQMGTLSGMLKDFKAQVTNNVSVNVPAGAVQITVKENKIDYDALAIKVGQRVIKQVRQALENQKPASASGTATPAS
ncbi:hypothetical protein [Paenibacillus nuruki]|uniref:hypothetical protein n=1 Tax=Paenibacillus nuruki TaxID=1886670 RepID=UPI0028049026|nr:hypothetical protein [Paenibacillus nuruki]CAJ1316289.1 hypothetical protein AASFL403_13795 [Paenibacillus nuruki]